MQLYVLFEHASGYGLFKVKEFEEVSAFQPQVEAAVLDSSKFLQVVQMMAFRAHGNAASALKNINAISEGILTEELSSFLEVNVPKTDGKKLKLGVSDAKLGAAINEALSIKVLHTGIVPEIIRGIRFHIVHYVKGLNTSSLKQTELGLGHSYSRSKVKFNVNRSDNMIIQSIALVDQLDKDINTFAMRMREWYSYHFPELIKIVPDNHQYAKAAHFIKNRNTLGPESLEELEKITMSEAKAQAILDAARMSMGMDISDIDLLNIERFAKRVVSLSEYRQVLAEYLRTKMNAVAPNLSAVIGEIVSARLISHAGSLTNLAKYPASTVQILGAEKALFRALKTRSNTPKYGLIYHSTYISRAAASNKGRISRYLANKCSIASRIDCFSENLTSVFGEKLRDQIEQRLTFFETGDIPKKNAEVMAEAVQAHKDKLVSTVKSEKKKRKSSALQEDEANVTVNGMNGNADHEESPKKKKKKKKKNADEETEQVNGDDSQIQEEEAMETEETPVPKKKKKKKKNADEEDLNGTVDESIVEPETPASGKKKKKNKVAEMDEAVAETETPVSEKKKKKKKKSMGSDEMEQSFQ